VDSYEDPTYGDVPAGVDVRTASQGDMPGGVDVTTASQGEMADAGADVTPETEEIRAEIEETRANLSATIDAIQEKLNPETLVEQVKETVKDTAANAVDQAKEQVREATVGRVEHMVNNATETARETGSGVIDMVRSNPIPAALIGLGLGWLFMNRQNQPGNGGRYDSRSRLEMDRDYRFTPPGYVERGGYSGSYGGSNTGTGYVGGGRDQRVYSSASYNSQASSNGGGIMDTIRQNPLPAAAAAVSIGWLLTRGGNNQQPSYDNRERYRYEGQWRGDGDRGVVEQAGQKLGDVASAAGDTVGNVASTAGDVASTAGDKVGQVASAAGETVGNVAGAAGDTVGNVTSAAGDLVGQAGAKVGQVVSRAGETAGDVTEAVQYGAQSAQTQFQRMFSDNPLAVGAVALALGAAVGLALPQTEQEHRLLGPARDNLVEKAQEVAQETMDKVQQVTDQVQQSAQQSAQEQGLTV